MKASAKLGANLQSVLVDLIELHVQGKQAHWSVVGKNFRDLHSQLDEIIDDARLFSDELAERMRALDAPPHGRSETVTATTHLPTFPAGEADTTQTIGLITDRLAATVDNIRGVHDEVDEEDQTSVDILHGSSRSWNSTPGWSARRTVPRVNPRPRPRPSRPARPEPPTLAAIEHHIVCESGKLDLHSAPVTVQVGRSSSPANRAQP